LAVHVAKHHGHVLLFLQWQSWMFNSHMWN